MRVMPQLSLEAIREALPATRRAAYLNAGSVGPLSRRAADVMRAQIERASEQGQIGPAAFEEWLGSFATAREAWGEIVGVTPDRIALTHSATGAMNLALAGLDLDVDDEVITTDNEHPGLDEPLAALARRRGIVVRRAQVVDGGDAVAAFESLLSPKTRLLALSHVLWGTGRVLPVGELSELAHAHGALTLVDGAQAVGAIPLNVDQLGVDLYGSPGQKWVCGPVGTGSLAVREELIERLEIGQPGYLTRDHLGEGHPYWPGARRFDGATLSAASLLGLSASIRWRADEVGLEHGHRLAADRAAAARRRLAEVPGVELVQPGDGEYGTLVAMRLAVGDPEPVYLALADRGVLVRFIPGTDLLRASIGYWNTDEDVESLAEGLEELAGAAR
jgi:L-cysteine/cystine lyase